MAQDEDDDGDNNDEEDNDDDTDMETWFLSEEQHLLRYATAKEKVHINKIKDLTTEQRQEMIQEYELRAKL